MQDLVGVGRRGFRLAVGVEDFVAPIIAMLYAQVNKIPTTGMDKEDLARFMILKSVVNQLPAIMKKTTKFEAGIELIK